MEHATLMLATCQLGITICSLLILNVVEPAIHHLLEIPLELTHLPEEVIGTIAFVITLIVVSFLHVVLGEMVPKNLSFSVPDRAVLILATPLVAIATVFRPIIVVLNATAERRAAAVPGRAEERGDQRVHRRRGRDDRGDLDTRGRADRRHRHARRTRSSSPRRRCGMSRSA